MHLYFARGVVLLCLFFSVAGCGSNADSGSATSGSTPATAAPKGERRPVVFVGFDASPPLVNALKQGRLQGLVLQNPYRMGELGVRTLVDHLEKRDVKKTVPTGEKMATPDNMADPEIAMLLNPPKEEHSTNARLTGAKSKTWRVMVIPKGTTHEFWKTIHAGAKKAADELGTVEIVWQGPLKEDDRTDQIKLVQNAVAAKVDGIVLAPLDSQALVAPVEQAIAAGIPVVIIDSGLNSKKTVSYVATDNYNGGVLAAERLAEVLHGEGKVILVRYMVGSESTEQREKGFLDTLKKYPKLTLISDTEYAGATADTALKTAQSLVLKFRGQFDGIFTPNESSTSGMLKALKDAGMLAGKP